MRFKVLNNEYYSQKYIYNIIKECALMNIHCQYCKDEKWDIIIEDKYTCGKCYDYIYNEKET